MQRPSLLWIMATALIVSWCLVGAPVLFASAAALVNVSCTAQEPHSTSITLDPNTTYVLHNCTVPIALLASASTSSTHCGGNVAILVQGGSTLPMLRMMPNDTSDPAACSTDANQTSRRGIRVDVTGVRMTQASSRPYPFISTDGGVVQNFECAVADSILQFQSPPNPGNSWTVSPFIDLRTQLIMVHANIMLLRTTVLMQANLSMAIVYIECTLNGRDDNGIACDNVSVGMRDSTLTVLLNATTSMALWGAKQETLDISTVRVYIEKRMDLLTICLVSCTVHNAIVPKQFVGFVAHRNVTFIAAVVSLASYFATSNAALDRCNITIAHVSSTVVGTSEVDVVRADKIGAFVNGTIAVVGLVADVAAVGYPLNENSPHRRGAVVLLAMYLVDNSAIRVAETHARISVFSGEVPIPSVLSSTILSLCAAEMVSVKSPMHRTTIVATNVQLVATLDGGYAIVPYASLINVFGLTMNFLRVALINFDKPDPIVNVNVAVDECTVDVEAMAIALPASVRGGSLFAGASIVSVATQATRCNLSVVNSSIVGASLAVDRSATPAGIGVPSMSVMAVFSAVDANTIVAAGNPYIAPLLNLLNGGLARPIALDRLSITGIGNNVMLLPTASALPTPLSTVAVSVVALPPTMVRSSIDVRGTSTATSGSGASAQAVTVLLCPAGCALNSSTISVASVIGVSTLISSIAGGIAITENSSLDFRDISVTAAASSSTVFWARPTSAPNTINVTASSLIRINASHFSGFTTLLNSTSVRCDERAVALSSGASVCIELGCNLWDGAALPLAAIGMPLERVAYPHGTFEGTGAVSTVVCAGIPTQPEKLLASSTLTWLPGLQTTISPVLRAASTVASVATFASSAGRVVPRVAVGAVQGILGLQRLAAACRGERGDEDGGGEAIEGEAALDNPLQLPLDVDAGRPELRYVAGAVVGNTVFAIVVGIALHACARGRKRVEQSLTAEPKLLERLLLCFFPTTLWPGCLLVPLGILLEPVTRMSVLLMALGDASAGALGAAVLTVWLTVVGFVAYRLLRVRPFPMRSVATRRILRYATTQHSPTSATTRRGRLLCALRTAVQWTTEPTECFAPRQGRQHREYAALLEEHYACAYEPYKAPYVAFFVVEYGSVVIVGVLLGAAGAVDAASACEALQWCGWLVAVVFLGVAAAVVWQRPFSVRSDTISTAAIQGLCAASAIATTLDSDTAVSEHLALAASCVELLVAAVGLATLMTMLGTVCARRVDRVTLPCVSAQEIVAWRHRLVVPRQVVGHRGSLAMLPDERPPSVPAHDALASLSALLSLICEQPKARTVGPPA